MNHTASRAGALAFAWTLAPLLTAFAVLALTLIHWTGNFAWDDGAITLAYARTLAEHGRFAVTPVSEVVEGSSSLLFTGLMAAVQSVGHLGFDALVRAAQWATLLFWMAVLVVMDRVLRPHLPHHLTRTAVLGLLAVLPMPLAEILNGMEMTLFALLLLGTSIAFERRSAWVWLGVPLLMLVRFEAAFYLGFALSALVVFDPRRRGQALATLAWLFVLFAVFTAWRWSYFGDVLPNTIRAKMHPPYLPASMGWPLLQAKSMGLLEFVKVNAVWLLALVLCAPARRPKGLWGHWARWDFKAWLVLAFGVFAALSGANWGYEGRMCLACLPLLVWLLCERISIGRSAGWARWGQGLLARPRVRVWLPVTPAGVLSWALVGTFLVNVTVVVFLGKTLIRGAYYQGLMPPALHDRVAQQLAVSRSESGNWLGVTPENFRTTGLTLDRIRQSLRLREVAVLTPDVGGLALCCEQIRVLDYGLLTSASLARTGYAGMAAYLQQERPDVAITHSFWSEDARIYELKPFTDHYVPVVVDAKLFWLRREHLPTMLASPMWRATRLADLQPLARARYGGWAIDMAYIRERVREPVWQFGSR